jgi:sugar lactone lactonase YvrE
MCGNRDSARGSWPSILLGGIIVWGLSCVVPSPALLRSEEPPCSPQFQRADVDASGSLEITDPIALLNYQFLGGEEPTCLDAADSNDDEKLDISDAVYILSYLFLGGAAPSLPSGECGVDPTGEDLLGCLSYPPCGGPVDEWQALIESCGDLETLAGNGMVDKDFNGWEAGFEGGLATEADLSNPHHAVSDAAGNVYIADKEAHAVRKVTPDGRIFTLAGRNVAGDDGDEPGPATERSLSNPNGVWARADGTVYILDLDNQKVRRVSTDGTMSTLFAVSGLVVGRGLWVSDAEDLAYVASGNKVVRWTLASGVETYKDGFTQLGNLVVEPSGDVLVTDRSRHQVYRIDGEGDVTVLAGNGTTFGGGDGESALETGLWGVRGIARLEGGGLFLATHEGSQVWYLDTKGIIHLFLDGSKNAHSGDGLPVTAPGRKVSEVRNVTVDAQGNILVTENDYGYIRIVRRVPITPCR